MAQSETQSRTLLADRDCPVCGEAVHWSRYWLRQWKGAKWECCRCHSELGFDGKWQLLQSILAGSAVFMLGLFKPRHLLVAALVVFLVVVLRLLDRVKVIGKRNPGYCPSCRYDLSGTISAGIGRCPECGRDLKN